MPQAPRLEFFFDCSSPWTYFAFRGVQALAAESGAALVWTPILVGGVFNAVNPTVYASRAQPVAAKDAYMRKDLADWAARVGLAIVFPPTVFPVNSAKAMRACIWADGQGALPTLAERLFDLYWRADEDIGQDAVIARACAEAGLDPGAGLAAASDPTMKAALRANTDDLIARGGFGSPTIFLDQTDMYFGNDRLPLVREALARRREFKPASAAVPTRPAVARAAKPPPRR